MQYCHCIGQVEYRAMLCYAMLMFRCRAVYYIVVFCSIALSSQVYSNCIPLACQAPSPKYRDMTGEQSTQPVLSIFHSLFSGDVDLCLVPEVMIELEGENGCLPFLKQRVAEQGHAVIVVAEGFLHSTFIFLSFVLCDFCISLFK